MNYARNETLARMLNAPLATRVCTIRSEIVEFSDRFISFACDLIWYFRFPVIKMFSEMWLEPDTANHALHINYDLHVIFSLHSGLSLIFFLFSFSLVSQQLKVVHAGNRR